MTLIAPNYLWRDGALVAGLVVETQDGHVVSVRPRNNVTPDLEPHLLVPAPVDLQVNGGGGVMVNSNPSAEGFRQIAAAHHRLGTGSILPTVITDRPEVMQAAAQAALETMGEPGLLGLHIEGPHIAEARRGTHSAEYIRPLDETTVTLVEQLRHTGVNVMITLAPELADPLLLGRLVASGAVVSAGHSLANTSQTRAALAAGLSCLTHLYNAMPLMASRDPGLVGVALNSEAYAGIIADGIHVDWDMVRIALRSRPRPGLMFLVSDAMATVGGPDHFELYEKKIHVHNGALINDEGSLAGAHIDMVTSLANLVRNNITTLSEAISMAADVPRNVLGLAPLRISEGTATRDIIALDSALTLTHVFE